MGRTAVMEKCDLVVVGAGTAGIPAALEAADGGLQVALLDKRDEIGGMLHLSGAQFSGGGTRRQRERGIEDSEQAHFEEVMKLGHGKAVEALVALSIPAQRELVDWLDSLGFDFDPSCPKLEPVHELYSVPRTYNGRNRGLSILDLLSAELEKRIVSGAIALHLSTRAAGIITGAGGAVTGVRAVRQDGSQVEFEAGAVILATGGYAADRQLMRRFVPEPYHAALTGCMDHATGDGLLMAEEIGAGVTDMGYFLPSMSLMPDPDRPGFTLGFYDARVMIIPAYRKPYEIWVNLLGQRFVPEDTTSSEVRERALMQQPELKMAIIWDQRIMDESDPILVPGWTRERIKEEAASGRFLWTAPTLPELAAKMGVQPQGLTSTVARYNEAVDLQRDQDFGRTTLPARIEQPPFYGLIHQAAMLATREGLTVDTDLRVLDRKGQPIQGLYAVGEVLGTSQFMGDSFVGGMIVGPAMALGRVVGQRVASKA